MSALDDDATALADALADAGRGGKRFRPRLVRQVHDLLGGAAGHDAVGSVAEAVELLHTAFVVHDDVIDAETMRRGRPSTSEAFRRRAQDAGAGEDGARTYGLAAAVLTGDLALAAAIRAVACAPAPPATVRRLLDLVDHALLVSATGELADVRFSLGLEEPTLPEVLAMEEHKTAVYSFSLPMQAGAVLAGAADEVVDGLGEVGRGLGIAFQLFDDLLGVFGDPARTGKGVLGDLREGKRTPLVVHSAGTSAWPLVRSHLGDPDLTPADAELVRAALESCGSAAFITQLAADQLDSALALAADLGLPARLLDWVQEMTGLLRRGAA